METFKDIVQILALVATVIAAIASWRQYKRNSSRDRTRWLFDLYQRFYEETKLRQMRIRIDEHDTEFVKAEDDSQLLADLDDFLNFFEFIAFLREAGELQEGEIRAMFDYPLSTVATDARIIEYARKYGYEKLAAMLDQVGYSK